MMRPLIIGMNNPVSTKPEHALYPYPPGCAGYRLWRMVDAVAPMTKHEYLEVFDRRNLVVGEWSMLAAREAAAVLWAEAGPSGAPFVLLGKSVAQAFDLGKVPLGGFARHAGVKFHVVGHPSGRSTWYNDAANREATGRLLAGLAGRI